MNRIQSLAWGILIAVLLGVIAWWSSTGGGDPTGPIDGVESAAVEADAGSRETTTDDAPGPLARVTIDPPPWIGDLLESELEEEEPFPALGKVTGRLAWQDGMPVEGARVRLQRWPRDTVIPEPGEDFAPPDDDPTATTVTTRTGEFELEYVPHRETLFLRFELRDGSVEIEDLRVPPMKGERAWQGEYRLDPRGVVTGTIVDAEGNPVHGARIRAVDEERFDDPAVPEQTREQRVAGAETLKADRLEAGRSLSRAVRMREMQLPYPVATSRGDGAFKIVGVREGTVHLIVQHDVLVSRRIEVPVVGGRTTDAGIIALGRGVPFAVRLLDPDLKPLVGVSVAVAPLGWRFGPSAAVSGADGIARSLVDIGTLPPGEDNLACEVRVRRAPGKPWVRIGATRFPGATWVLAQDGAFDVEVSTRDGSIPDRIQFGTRPETKGLSWRGSGKVYRISGVVPEAGASLYAVAEGYAPAFAWVAPVEPHAIQFALGAEGDDFAELAKVERVPRPQVQMTLEPTFAMHVRVVDDYQMPVAGARVTFATGVTWLWGRWNAGPVDGWRLGVTDANGELLARGLWRTTTAFTAWHPERGRVHLGVEEVTPDSTVVIQMLSPARLTGSVLENGRPVSRRYLVRLANPPGPKRPPFGALTHDPIEVATNDAGRFEIPRVGPWPWSPEAWQVSITEPPVPNAGRAFAVPRQPRDAYFRTELVLHPGERADVTFDLSEQRQRHAPGIVGSVRLGGVPVPGAIATLWDLEAKSFRVKPSERGAPRFETIDAARRLESSRTDAIGQFELTNSGLAGKCELRVCIVRNGQVVELLRQPIERKARRSTAKEAAPILIDLPIGDLVLTLMDVDGMPFKNRPVTLRAVGGIAQYLVLTDEFGVVRENGLIAGAYAVSTADRTGLPIGLGPNIEVSPTEPSYERRIARRQ